MKNWMKKITAAALSAALVFSVAGCGGNDAGAKELLDKAAVTMESVKSMSATLDTEIAMDMDGQKADSRVVTDVIMKQDPMQMQIDMTLSINGEGDKAQAFAEERDGALYYYMNMDGAWHSQKIEEERLDIYNADKSINMYLKNMDGLKTGGTEKIGKKEATKITGDLKGDALLEAIKVSGIENTAMGMGMPAEEVDKLCKEVGSIPVDMWIDADGYVLKYEIELSVFMQKIMDKLFEGVQPAEGEEAPKVKITATKLSMECRDFNKVKKVPIPEEARAVEPEVVAPDQPQAAPAQ